jgi:hypothetical protein
LLKFNKCIISIWPNALVKYIYIIVNYYLENQIILESKRISRRLTPISTIFQLYRGGQFLVVEKTTGRQAGKSAHRGPSFMGWHRILLVL